MTGWAGLISSALLGTGRRVPDTASLPDPVRRLTPDAADDPARALLVAAALMTGYRRAGRLPESDLRPIPPAPDDRRPLVPQAARLRLGLLLGGHHADLLPEWLAAVAERGLRVPPELLPALAEMARARSASRPAVAAAAGPRGEWLARLRPDWEFLAERRAPEASPDSWEYGGLAERREWLAATRRADPASARTALAGVWSAEPAAVRAQLLAELRTGLSEEDEQFLESALDDRAQDVRRGAAELLMALPESALSGRMAARVRALVTVEHGRRLEVRLPAACDPGMRRDGIVPTPPRGTGARAWWLHQLVGAAPLAVWPRNPAALVAMPVRGCDAELVHSGWAVAAARQHDLAWARALLGNGADTLPADRIAELMTVLPHQEWGPIVARLVTRGPLARLAGLFLSLPAPWPVDLASDLLDLLAGHADQRGVAHVADVAARAVPRACLDHPLTRQPLTRDASSPWRRRLIETLAFRRAMYEELS